MELKNIVLHQIVREENEKPKLNSSGDLLNHKEATVIEFVEKITGSFRSKKPTYGEFQSDKNAYPFQKLVKIYLTAGNFLTFSKEAMKLLAKEIQVPGAKGGYVVFAHYTFQSSDFLITIMLDKSEQFTTDDNSLSITKLKTLDIDKLARANRINLSKWENTDGLYLSFIKGTRDVSGYFQKFIGNTDLTSSVTNTKNLNEAVSKFMRIEEFTDDKKEKANKDLNEYLERQFAKKEDVKIEAVAAYLLPDEPAKFSDFVANDEAIEVSGSYRLTRKADFSVFHRATIKGSGFKIQFEKELIKQKKVIRVGNDVIFKDLPKDELDKQFTL